MNPTMASITGRSRADELRAAFDATFAAPASPEVQQAVLVLLRAGESLLAVRREAMSGFARPSSFVRTPGRSPAFSGIYDLRGDLYPVWSLSALLDRGAAVPAAPAWLVLTRCGDGTACAFGCEALDGLVIVAEQSISLQPGADGRGALGRTAVQVGPRFVPLVDIPLLQEEVRRNLDSLRQITSPSSLP